MKSTRSTKSTKSAARSDQSNRSDRSTRFAARLGPTMRDRMQLLIGSKGFRILVLRRAVAAVLAVLAAVLALLPQHRPPAPVLATVVVAARDLAPGIVVARNDVVVRTVPAQIVPGQALHAPAQAVGHVLSGAARRGETLTDVRLVDSVLTGNGLAGGGPPESGQPGKTPQVAVPIRLADSGVAELLYPGQRVDVIAGNTSPGNADTAQVLAERATVIAVRPPEGVHS